jgi:hypothetical protein
MDEYNKYKAIFCGLNNIKDVNKLANILKLDTPEKVIINNYFNTLNCQESLSYDEFLDLINSLKKLKYREDVIEHYYKLSYKIKDKTQINTIKRIINSKESKTNTDNIKYKNKNSLLKFKCPHCTHINTINEFENYAICGYNNINEGYDWEGCSLDWCAKCGKRLCKKWFDNELFLQENRFHDNECCFVHSKKYNLNYFLDYCHCSEYYVNRCEN